MDREKMDEFFTKLLGPNKGAGQGYKPGWTHCDIARTTGGHLLTFHYRGSSCDYKRKFSLTEMQGKDVLPVLFPQAFRRGDVEVLLAKELKRTQEELVDAQAVAAASTRYGARMLEEKDAARKELEEAPNTPHPANRLYQAIVKAVEPFFSKEEERSLEWDVLPGALARRFTEMRKDQGLLAELLHILSKELTTSEGAVQVAQRIIAERNQAQNRIEELLAQLPEGMKHCTLFTTQCAVGHTQLTAKNWVQHERCPWCEIKGLQAQVQELQSRNDLHQRDDCADLPEHTACTTGKVEITHSMETPMERLRAWFGTYHGEEGEPLQEDMRAVCAMAEELVRARVAMSDLGVESSALPNLITYLKKSRTELEELCKEHYQKAESAFNRGLDAAPQEDRKRAEKAEDMIAAIRGVMGQPKDDQTPEDVWVKIYYDKLRGAAEIALSSSKRRAEQRDALAKELRDVRKMARSWIKMSNQLTDTRLYRWALQEGAPAPEEKEQTAQVIPNPFPNPVTYTAKGWVEVEVWQRNFNSTMFLLSLKRTLKEGDTVTIHYDKGVAEVEIKETHLPPAPPDGGKCADNSCNGFGCPNCDRALCRNGDDPCDDHPCGND
jgi:hypothetical protein